MEMISKTRRNHLEIISLGLPCRGKTRSGQRNDTLFVDLIINWLERTKEGV